VQGVNSLQDLKTKLTLAGFEIKQSEGWFIDTIHGRWTMALGVIYLEGAVCNKIEEAAIKKTPVKKPDKKKKSKKSKSKNR
jgi:hypothetical protein